MYIIAIAVGTRRFSLFGHDRMIDVSTIASPSSAFSFPRFFDMEHALSAVVPPFCPTLTVSLRGADYAVIEVGALCSIFE